MKHIKEVVLVFLFAGLLAACQSVVDGVTAVHAGGVVFTGQQTDEKGITQPMTMYLEAGKVRIEMAEMTFIYRDDLKKMWWIMPDGKTYMEFVSEDFAKLKQLMTAAQKNMLKYLPPEQRKAIEESMASQDMSSKKDAKSTYTKKASGQTVGAWTCDVYEVSQNGVKESEICVVPVSEIGLSMNDFNIFQLMDEFYGDFAGQGGSSFGEFDEMAEAIGYEAFPVREISFDSENSGKPSNTWVLEKIERKKIEASVFELPPGLKKTPNMVEQQLKAMKQQ